LLRRQAYHCRRRGVYLHGAAHRAPVREPHPGPSPRPEEPDRLLRQDARSLLRRIAARTPIRLIAPDFLGEFATENSKDGKISWGLSPYALPLFPSSCEFARFSSCSVL